jgi:hypothetical protein
VVNRGVQLSTQALTCSMASLTDSSCTQRVQACWISSQQAYSYLNAPCLPSAFSSNSLSGLADPFVIAGAPEDNLTN